MKQNEIKKIKKSLACEADIVETCAPGLEYITRPVAQSLFWSFPSRQKNSSPPSVVPTSCLVLALRLQVASPTSEEKQQGGVGGYDYI